MRESIAVTLALILASMLNLTLGQATSANSAASARLAASDFVVRAIVMKATPGDPVSTYDLDVNFIFKANCRTYKRLKRVHPFVLKSYAKDGCRQVPPLLKNTEYILAGKLDGCDEVITDCHFFAPNSSMQQSQWDAIDQEAMRYIYAFNWPRYCCAGCKTSSVKNAFLGHHS